MVSPLHHSPSEQLLFHVSFKKTALPAPFSIFTKIYPNPSTGKIQIIIDDLKFIKNSSIEIFNMQGVIIYKSEIINTKFDIDLINQTKGFYFVKICAGEKFFTRKILIE